MSMLVICLMLQHCTPRLNSLALDGASLTQAAARFPSKSAQGSRTAAARQIEFDGSTRNCAHACAMDGCSSH